jgi:hypothetical protein
MDTENSEICVLIERIEDGVAMYTGDLTFCNQPKQLTACMGSFSTLSAKMVLLGITNLAFGPGCYGPSSDPQIEFQRRESQITQSVAEISF